MLSLIQAIVAQDSTATSNTSYPRRLVTDFPNIYCDTIFTNHKCFIVARAVWKKDHRHPVKMTGNHISLLPIDSTHVVTFKKSPAKQQSIKKRITKSSKSSVPTKSTYNKKRSHQQR